MFQVYVDLGYYFDWPTADKLLKVEQLIMEFLVGDISADC